jgi:hypothetical protein
MFKLLFRFGVVALAVLATVYGCGDSDSPMAPRARNASNLLKLPTCGEDSYLSDLTAVTLPDWQDSVEAWLPGVALNEAPQWAPESNVPEFLGLLLPALSQWESAISAAYGSALLDTVPAFDGETNTTQSYLGDLSALIVGWESAMETARGMDFLLAAPVFQPDTVAPTLECPADTTISCADAEGAVVEFELMAADDCDVAPVVSSEPPSGSLFPPGTTTVNCSATDASGNTMSCSFDVTVNVESVTINSVTANPAVIWPPNHKMVDVAFDVDAENACELELSCTILQISCNEPVNANGDGNTEPDWVVGEDGSLKLRAERSGPGRGRVYTIRVRCEDANGVGDEASVEVMVPHDQGGGSDD